MEVPAPTRTRWPLVLGLAVLAAVEGLVLREIASLPAPLPVTAPAEAFSAARAREVLARLVEGEHPRPTGSREADAFRGRVIDELRALGLQPEVHEGQVVSASSATVATIRNVVAVVPGRDAEGKVVLLEAHSDSVAAGPGVSDDASGVACLIEIARALRSGEPPLHPVVLLIDEGEETGLLGARLFAEEHALASRVGAAVVLEARGTNGPSALWRLATDGRGNGWLIDAAREALSRPVSSSEIATLAAYLPNDTDMTVFREHEMTGFDLAFAGGSPRYHSPQDNLAALDLRTLQHHGQGGLELARHLAASDFGAGEEARHVAWLDVLGRGLVAWRADFPWQPLRWAAWIVALTAGVVVMARRRAFDARGFVAGLVAPLAIVTVAGPAGFGIVALEQRLTGSTAAATAHAWLTTTAVAFAALAAGLAILALLPRRCTATGAIAGAALAWIATAVALRIIPAEIHVLIPELAGALLALATLTLGLAGGGPRAAAWLSLVPLACVAAPVLELGYALHVMSGAVLPVIGVVPAAIVATLLVPVAAETTPRARWACAGAALLVSLGFLGLAMRAPSFTPDEPRHVNVTYLLDAAAPRAWWRLAPEDEDPPQRALSGPVAAEFTERVLDGWPGVMSRVVAAPAPVLALPGARVEVVSDDVTDAARRLVLRVVPSGDVLEIVLRVTPLVEKQGGPRPQLRVGGRLVGEGSDEFVALRLIAPAADGVEIELELPGGGAAEVLAFERISGLPEGADAPVRARVPSAAPAHGGDRTIVLTRVAL